MCNKNIEVSEFIGFSLLFHRVLSIVMLQKNSGNKVEVREYPRIGGQEANGGTKGLHF